MTKPPTFTECTICGREFGSKSIVIHERQCLQKLRKTEIMQQEAELQSTNRRKKKPGTVTAKAESNNSQKSVIVTSVSPELLNLPKIPTKNHGSTSSKVPGNAPKEKPKTIRPTTATLARPQILNPEYIQYDMSLTRIDYTKLQRQKQPPAPAPKKATTDENHNSNHNNRTPQRQSQLDDMNSRSSSNVVLPAVTGISASSLKGKQQYQQKGIDPEYRITKLPESALTTFLGEPAKKYGYGYEGGSADDTAILPRHTDPNRFQIPLNVPVTANPASTFPTLLCDPLKKGHVSCTSTTTTTDEKYNLPQIENVRATDEPNDNDKEQESHVHFVTPGFGALSFLPSSSSTGPGRIHGVKDEDEEQEQEFGEDEDEETEFYGERHFYTPYTYSSCTTLPSDINKHSHHQEVSRSFSHEPGTSWGNFLSESEIVQEAKYSSSKSSLEFFNPTNTKSFEDIIVLKEGEPLEIIPTSSFESGVTLKTRPPGWGRRKSRILSEPLPELKVWSKIVVSVDSDTLEDSDYEKSPTLDSDDQYETANSGDAEDENSSGNYFIREQIKPDFVEDSTAGSISMESSSCDCDDDSYVSEDTPPAPTIIRYHSAPDLLLTQEFHQKIRTNFEFDVYMQAANSNDLDDTKKIGSSEKGYNWMSGDDGASSDDGSEELLIKPSVNAVTTIPSTTSPIYSNIPDPIPQISTEELHDTNTRPSKSAESTMGSSKILKSILKKPSLTTTMPEKVESDDSLSLSVSTKHQPKSKASSFTGSDSDDEGSCNKSFTQLFNSSVAKKQKRARPLTRRARSAKAKSDQPELESQPPLIQTVGDEISETPVIAMPVEEFEEEEKEMTFDELVTELAELLQADKSQLEHLPDFDDDEVVEELMLTALLKKELRKHKSRSRRTSNLTLTRERQQQLAQLQKVRDWLETCEPVVPKEPVEVWANIESPNSESITKSPTPPEIDSIVEEFPDPNAVRVCHSATGESNTNNKTVSGLLSAVFKVKDKDKSRLYKFTDEIHIVGNGTENHVHPAPEPEENNQVDNEALNEETEPWKKALLNRSAMPLPQVGKIKTPVVSARVTTGKKTLGIETLKPQPNSARKTAITPRPSSPVKQTATKRPKPESPTKLKPAIVHCPPLKSKSQAGPPQRQKRIRPSTPQIGHKFGNVYIDPKPAFTPLAQLKQTLKNPVQTQVKYCQVPERRSAYSQYSPPLDKKKSPPVSGKSNRIGESQQNKPQSVSKSARSVRFMDATSNNDVGTKISEQSRLASIEMNTLASRTHLIYQFQPKQIRGIISGKSSMKSSVGEQKQSIFPSKYTLMMPKNPVEGKCANLNIIIRRRGSDGTLPLVETVVSKYSEEWMYLIVDEENPNWTKRTQPFVKPQSSVQVSRPKTQTVSGKETKILPRKSEDVKSRCICGLEFNCHEVLRTDESLERQTYTHGRYSSKYTVTIQLYTQIPRNDGAIQKYKLMNCPLCEKTFHPDRKTEITGHLESCLRKFLVQLPGEMHESLGCSGIKTYRLACV